MSVAETIDIKTGVEPEGVSQEKPSYILRHEAALAMVKRFQDEPRVQELQDTWKARSLGEVNYNSGTERYRKEISSLGTLTREEEEMLFGLLDDGVSLWELMEDEDSPSEEEKAILIEAVAARQLIFLCNIRWATRIALNVVGHRGTMGEEDVISEASMGLARAISCFDVSKGYKFSTYSHKWIKKSVERAVAEQSRTIILPLRKHSDVIKLSKFKNKFSMENGREPYIAEIVANIEIPKEYMEAPEEYVNLLEERGSKHLPSLNQPVDSTGTELGDLLGQADPKYQPDLVANESEKEIAQILNRLSDREASILVLSDGLLEIANKYGISVPAGWNGEPMLHRDIAKIYGISQDGSSQIKKEAIGKLKEMLSR